MDSSATGCVVLTAEKKAAVNQGIGLILSRWTAMRAAVDYGWGGNDSQATAERTVSKVFDYFIQSKDPLDILDAGLDELNTVADDGSLDEVTKKLLDLYKDCRNGIFKMVEELRLTKPQTRASVVKASNGNDDDDDEESNDDDDDEDEEDTCINSDQDKDMMVDDSEHCSKWKPEAMPVDEPVADDGWTVKTRKNKGKRN